MATTQVRCTPEGTSHPGRLTPIADVASRRAAEEGDPEAERQGRGGRDGGQGRDRGAQDRARGDQEQSAVAAAQQPPQRPLRRSREPQGGRPVLEAIDSNAPLVAATVNTSTLWAS